MNAGLQKLKPEPERAFTLIELLVVAAVIALLWLVRNGFSTMVQFLPVDRCKSSTYDPQGAKSGAEMVPKFVCGRADATTGWGFGKPTRSAATSKKCEGLDFC